MPAPSSIHRRAILVLALAAAASIGGCGTADEDAQLRFANVSASGATLDVYRDSKKVFGPVAAGSTTDYDGFAEATNTWSLRAEGGASSLVSTSLSLADKASYTMLGYGGDGNLQLAAFKEGNSAPSSGYVKLRVFNAAPDAGALDVFVSDDAVDLSSASVTLSSVAYGSVTGFATITSGSQRIRVTANGDRTDLRLDLRDVSLSNRSIITLVIAPGGGGVLVNALLLPEKNTASMLLNSQARLRVANGLSGNASASVTWGGSSIASGQRAPSVGSYALVDAGSSALAVTIGDAGGDSGGTATLTAGSDYTLLLTGAAGSSSLDLLADDNRLPTSSGKTKIRLVNGVTGSSDALSLIIDYNAVATGVGSGVASGYATITPPASGRMEVEAATLGDLYLNTDITLNAQAVYSVFMLGDVASPATVLRKDH